MKKKRDITTGLQTLLKSQEEFKGKKKTFPINLTIYIK